MKKSRNIFYFGHKKKNLECLNWLEFDGTPDVTDSKGHYSFQGHFVVFPQSLKNSYDKFFNFGLMKGVNKIKCIMTLNRL